MGQSGVCSIVAMGTNQSLGNVTATGSKCFEVSDKKYKFF